MDPHRFARGHLKGERDDLDLFMLCLPSLAPPQARVRRVPRREVLTVPSIGVTGVLVDGVFISAVSVPEDLALALVIGSGHWVYIKRVWLVQNCT